MEIKTKSENLIGKIQRPHEAGNLAGPVAVMLLCVGLSAIVVIPFFFMGRSEDGSSGTGLRMPTTHDMFLHYDQMRSFYEGMKAGEVYPRWEQDTNRGFGAPTTSYYPPGVYYVTSAWQMVTGEWIKTLMWTQLMMMVMSGAAMYMYARRVMSRWAAAVAMVAYVVGPYHLLDQYQRGAIAELMGFIFMPLMMWSAEELMRAGNKQEAKGRQASKDNEEQEAGEKGAQGERTKRERSGRMKKWMWGMAGLGASYGGFVWTHPPTAYQYSLGMMVYVMGMGIVMREWKGVIRVGAGMLIGIGLSAAYIVPAALEQNFINSDNITQTYPYHDSYTLVRLGVYSGHPDYFLALIDRIWILTALFIVIAAIVLLVFKARAIRRAPRLKKQITLWFLLGWFICFMMTSLSYPLGRLIPKIDIGVFTWRMLSITTFVVALLAGALAHVAFKSIRRRKHEAALAASVAIWIIIGSAWFSLEEVVKPYSNGDAFRPEPEHFNYALMPRNAYGDVGRLPVVEPASLARGNGSVTVERWSPERRAIKVELTGPDRLLLRTFNFPGWTATVDDRPANIIEGRGLRVHGEDGEEKIIRNLDYSNSSTAIDNNPPQSPDEVLLGDIVIEMEPGTHEVKLEFLPTPVRRKSNFVTLASIGLLAALILTPFALDRPKRRSRS